MLVSADVSFTLIIKKKVLYDIILFAVTGFVKDVILFVKLF